jgi:hypothetical protein
MRTKVLSIIAMVIYSKTFGQSYPDQITKLGLQNVYDESKWAMYCIYCDEHVKFENNKIRSAMTFGEMSLKLNNVSVRDDTTEMNYYFYYDTLRIDYTTTTNYPFAGVVFKGGKQIYYSTFDVVRYIWVKCDDIDSCTDRWAKPLQPKVVQYIKENASKLDPWFKREAIKRGILTK